MFEILQKAKRSRNPTVDQTRRLVSFIDGRTCKLLKRHLTTHGPTPHEYRARCRLPADYPMTTPGYSQKSPKPLGLGAKTRMRGALA